MSKKIRCHHEQQGDGERANDPGHLRLGSGGLGNGRARRAAANREALEKSGGQIGRPKSHHLLVGVDVSSGPRRVGTRQHAGVSERYQGHRAAADQDGCEIGVSDPRDGERGQALGKRAKDRDAGAPCQVESANDNGRADNRDQDARQALAALEQQDRRQSGDADHECRPVGLAIQHRLADRPQASQRTFSVD